LITGNNSWPHPTVTEQALDEIDFSFIPIWIRVSRLPMGLMNKTVVATIVDEVGEFMKVAILICFHGYLTLSATLTNHHMRAKE